MQFSAAIEAAHFPADLRNAALSAFEEGAPFMGTALAAHRQCIGAEVVCIFTFFYFLIFFANISYFKAILPRFQPETRSSGTYSFVFTKRQNNHF